MPPRKKSTPPQQKHTGRIPQTQTAPQGWEDEFIPEWDDLTNSLQARGQGIGWGSVLVALWKFRTRSDNLPKAGSRLYVEFQEGTNLKVQGEFPAPPPPPPPPPTQPLGFSPITHIQTIPADPPTQPLGLSPITTIDTPAIPSPPPPPMRFSRVTHVDTEPSGTEPEPLGS
ncbi:hypothetical protein BDZ91DRAFT_753818, partial [Kalaharituber pfeilii]